MKTMEWPKILENEIYFFFQRYLKIIKLENNNYLRVLGSPNPGQSFGRGLSGPQATEVSMDPGGSWAATNLIVHSSNSFLGPSFWQRALGSYSRNACFDVFLCFRVFKPEKGTWILVVSWRTKLCNI